MGVSAQKAVVGQGAGERHCSLVVCRRNGGVRTAAETRPDRRIWGPPSDARQARRTKRARCRALWEQRPWSTSPMDSELANDRTFLAWLRTAIAIFGLGFVVAKISLIVQSDATRLENKDLYSSVGVLIVLSGAALVVVGYLQDAHVWRLL